MKRFLVGIDESDGSARALALAIDLAEKFAAEIILAHVADAAEIEDDEWQAACRRYPGIADDLAGKTRESGSAGAADIRRMIGQRLLAEAAKTVAARGRVSCRTILAEGDAAEQLPVIVREEAADCIVVGRRGLRGLGAILMDSISTAMVQNAPCHVLVAA